MKKIVVTAAAVLVLGVVAAALVWRPARRTGVFYAMGGIPVRVVAYGRTPSQFDDDLDAVRTGVEHLENIFSRHRLHSELAELNRAGRGCHAGISAPLAEVLVTARRWYETSGGAFDVTVTPFIEMWKRAGLAGRMPHDADIHRLRKRVGMRHMHIRQGHVCFDRDDITIDLGAIAKGAILDRAADVLRGRGVSRGVIDAGGDVIAFGEGLFTIGVQNPFAQRRGDLVGVIEMPAGAVVTSGGYERYVVINGKRLSHIIDPRTGMPAEAVASVTIVGPRATDADAMATAVTVLGREAGLELVKATDGYDAMIIDREGAARTPIIWATPRMAAMVTVQAPWENRIRVVK